MEYVYSALLLHSAKQAVNEENVKKVLQAVSITPDQAKVKALIASLEGVNIDEVVKEAAMAPVAAGPAAGAGEKKKEEPEEDEGKKAEEAAAGLSALFG
jgi:large subunit ribosomal protein L12